MQLSVVSKPVVHQTRSCSARNRMRSFAIQAAVKQVSGITVDSNPSQEKLQSIGVFSWPTWGSPVDKFPWTYDDDETCYVLEGEVVVTPDGGEPVEIKKGDFATFPKGMSCTWDVKKAISKHYKFGQV
eukprot:TRINITY_DN5098_c0_g1_i1.p2 TRINITY_DN5098_c0_g1~~TRINITY_DN5098_c0_g1_i1.p2  ORF type:complete len:128 (-),score=15.51 TRINITY_DN5098_c0_g1_i1:341-724(-)